MKKYKITIIEDDADLRALITLALKGESYEVTSFAEGSEFLQDHATADLYIIDINLGGISGLELCKKIKANAVTTPIVIIISANPDISKMAQEVCADDVLAKPFTSRNLVTMVVNYLASECSTYS